MYSTSKKASIVESSLILLKEQPFVVRGLREIIAFFVARSCAPCSILINYFLFNSVNHTYIYFY
jgi:hypothetical protein